MSKEPIKVTPVGPPLVLEGEGIGEFYADAAEAERNLDALATPIPLEEWAGPIADAAELEQAHGIAPPLLAAWEQDGLVIALPAGDHSVYPTRQFVGARPVPGLGEVLAVVGRPRVAWLWLVSRQPRLGRPPLDALIAGDIAAVRDAVDRDYGQQI